MNPSLLKALIFISPLTAAAEPVSDIATGLAVNPPQGYVAASEGKDAKYAAMFVVRKISDDAAICRVGFQPVPQYAKLTQTEINVFLVKPEWAAAIRASIRSVFNVLSLESFEHGGAKGVMILADPQKTSAPAPYPEEIRNLIFMQETPKGRTTTICVGRKSVFNVLRREFEQVARAVKIPR